MGLMRSLLTPNARVLLQGIKDCERSELPQLLVSSNARYAAHRGLVEVWERANRTELG